ncbi:hypothetical protein PG984_007918 [Apiospora sp. TS-2023a]
MTMLLVNPQESHSHYYVNYRMPTPPSESSTILQLINMSSQYQDSPAPAVGSTAENEVAQALEIARESPDGAKDPVVSSILENALVQIWTKVQAQPDSYVMSRDEFAVFNFFQYRFAGNKVAIAARKRYWDNTTGP